MLNKKCEDIQSEQQIVINKLAEERTNFEAMNLQYTSNLEKLQVFEITSADHLDVINKLRKENEHLK